MDEIVITVERRAGSGMWNASYSYGDREYIHCEETIDALFLRMGRLFTYLITEKAAEQGVSAEGASWAMEGTV